MNELKYRITSFDKELKLLEVKFDDGSWAQIRLTTPLPKTLIELEEIIKQFSAPVEAIEAQVSPDADLSYISNIVGVERVCERQRLSQPATIVDTTIDPEVEAALVAEEEAEFEARVTAILSKLGIYTQP